MTETLTPLAPAAVADRIRSGHALLIDVREADEFARRHVPGALSVPLSTLGRAPLPAFDGTDIVFTCRSGMRTSAACAQLAAHADRPAYVLTGGIDGWARAGLPVTTNRAAPLEMMRQVQIVAGLLILTGVMLGLFVAPGFFGLAAFVGAGLTVAGVTGFCGMAKLLALMPWNRAVAG
jgi:rhodanese-related sulfurtransferase